MVSKAALPSTPTAPAYHRIESVRITGGYLRDLDIQLAPGLNCLIGGTGAGKTTLLVLILFGLGAPFPPSSAAHHERLVADALPTGRVLVRVRTKLGAVYESSRAYGELPRVTNAEGQAVDVKLVGEIFDVEYHATKEIERIASDAGAQLALIDRIVEPELRPVDGEIGRVVARLRENAGDLARLGREVADEEEQAAEVPVLVEALRGLQPPAGLDPLAAKRAFDDKQKRVRERAALTYQTELVDARKRVLDAFARDRGMSKLDAELDGGPNAEVFTALAAELRTLDRVESEAVGRLSAGLDRAHAAIAKAALALAGRHAVADDAYQATIALDDRGRGILAERARLEKRLGEMSAIAKRHEARRRDLGAVREARGRMLGELAQLRAQRLVLREGAVSEINEALSGRVRVSLHGGEDRAAYEALLAACTSGANIRPATYLKTIVRELRPEELAAAALADDIEPLVALDTSKTNKNERAKNVLAALRASGRVFELETVGLGDLPLIELVTDAGYQPADRLSSGERCAAILPIVLLRSRGPLIIDEPEQHLHNKYIYSVLVKLMAEAELAGQLLFATHNANIVALGDAKRVFAMAGGGGHGVVEEFGTVEELKSAIVILEGGREALERRAQSYRSAPA